MIKPTAAFQEQAKERGWKWLDTVDSLAFNAAATAALAQMQLNNAAPPDMATAASYAWRMEGAKQFLSVLMSLTLPQESKPRQISGMNLDHKL